jgi:neutral ceramidase
MGLRAGVAMLDITPPLGTKLRGYFEERVATNVHDPLNARAFVLDNGESAIAVAVCDIIALAREYMDRAKARIAESTGLPPERVLIACTHTHTGPETGDDPYTEALVGKIADVVQVAWNRRAPAAVGWGRAEEPRPVFNRRYRMKDGTVQTNPGIGRPEVVEPVGPIDPEVGALCLRRPCGGVEGVLANYALHYVGIPDDMDSISADYFGYFSGMLPRMLGQPFVAALSNGASGDINNLDVLGGASPANDHYQHVERIAGLVAAAALWAINGATYSDDVALGGAMTEVVLKPRPAPSPDDVARADEIQERVRAGVPVLMGERSFANRVRRLVANPPRERATWVQALRIGDLAIVGAPGEFFVELGMAIKRRSPFGQTMVLELANDCVGYIATSRAYEEGAYEPESSPYAAGIGEQIVEAAVGLLERLGPE